MSAACDGSRAMLGKPGGNWPSTCLTVAGELRAVCELALRVRFAGRACSPPPSRRGRMTARRGHGDLLFKATPARSPSSRRSRSQRPRSRGSRLQGARLRRRQSLRRRSLARQPHRHGPQGRAARPGDDHVSRFQRRRPHRCAHSAPDDLHDSFEVVTAARRRSFAGREARPHPIDRLARPCRLFRRRPDERGVRRRRIARGAALLASEPHQRQLHQGHSEGSQISPARTLTLRALHQMPICAAPTCAVRISRRPTSPAPT